MAFFVINGETLTGLADKIRALLGVTGLMSTSAMATNLETEQSNIANAFTAVGNKGGTVSESQVSGNLADAINSIPVGGDVKVASGTVTGVSGIAKSVTCTDKSGQTFKPDAVFFTGTIPQKDNKKCHAGVAFHETNTTTMMTLFSGSSSSYLFSYLTVTQTSTGFSVSGTRFSNSMQGSNESNRSLNYIAIKYTE